MAPSLVLPIPRPRGRGPVEAFHFVSFLFPFCSFRARAGAAPLKPTPRADLVPEEAAFRARAGAAPLKLDCGREFPREAAAFRARAGATPLKPRKPIRGRRAGQHSAPARARPR